MTIPPPPQGQQPPPQQQGDGLDDAALAVAIAALLAALTVTAAYATSVAGMLALLKARFALSAAALQALGAVLTLVTEHPTPLTGIIGAASAQTSKMNAARRAQYVIAASKRVLGAAREARAKGEPVGAAIADQLARERRFYELHQAAMWNRAAAAGKTDMAAAEHGDLLGWNTIRDKRASAECLAADGRNYRASRMPDIGFPGAVHPHCFPAGTEVASSSLRAAATRWYRGELIELTTFRGHYLAVTPNHPVLTPQGWVAAGLLDEGREVVSTRFGQSVLMLVDPDDYQQPAPVEDVLSSFSEHLGMLPVSVPVSAEDFHGDGTAGEIAEIWADRVLVSDLESSHAQPCRIQQFGGVSWHRAVQSLGPSAPFFPGVRSAPHSLMGRENVARVLFRRPVGHHEPVGLGDRTARYSMPLQDCLDDGASSAMRLREFVLTGPAHVRNADEVFGQFSHRHAGSFAALTGEVVGSSLVPQRSALLEAIDQRPPRDVHFVSDPLVSEVAGLVEFDRLVKVRRRSSWSGHVFNLESSSGWLISNNIITHNCRCFPGPPHPNGKLLPTRGLKLARAA